MIKIVVCLFLFLNYSNCLSCKFVKDLLPIDKIKIDTTFKKIVLYKKPSIPTSNYMKNIKQGCIKVSFIINNEGNATNIKILNANPVRIFNRTIIHSLKSMKFLYSSHDEIVESVLIYKYEPVFGIYIWK